MSPCGTACRPPQAAPRPPPSRWRRAAPGRGQRRARPRQTAAPAGREGARAPPRGPRPDRRAPRPPAPGRLSPERCRPRRARLGVAQRAQRRAGALRTAAGAGRRSRSGGRRHGRGWGWGCLGGGGWANEQRARGAATGVGVRGRPRGGRLRGAGRARREEVGWGCAATRRVCQQGRRDAVHIGRRRRSARRRGVHAHVRVRRRGTGGGARGGARTKTERVSEATQVPAQMSECGACHCPQLFHPRRDGGRERPTLAAVAVRPVEGAVPPRRAAAAQRAGMDASSRLPACLPQATRPAAALRHVLAAAGQSARWLRCLKDAARPRQATASRNVSYATATNPCR